MPKFKRATAAHSALQAKKRKRNQREDPVKRQQEQERSAAARRRLRVDNPEIREQEQQLNTAAHRRIRQENPERRHEEQQLNTAAHRRIRQEDPERRHEEQQRDTAAHRRIRQEDPERRHEEQQRDTAAHQRIRLENPERRHEEQERNTIGNSKLCVIVYIYSDIIAHRVARENPVQRLEEQQRDLLHHREARSDPDYQAHEQHINNVRRQQVRSSSRQASFRALHYQPNNFYNTTDIGTVSLRCSNCGALKFEKETDSLCCSKGNVQLDEFPQVQSFLQHLYEGIDSIGKHFLANIRKYNSVFQMTSFGCNEVSMTGFNPSFRIQGQVYQIIGSILPSEGESPKFAQIYFIGDEESEITTRTAIIDGLKPDIIRGINQLLHEDNQYVEMFKVAKEIFEQEGTPTNVKIVINETKRPSGEHSRRYNRPLSDDIAVLMPNDVTNNRDIVLHYRDGGLQHISELHRSYDPLQYPLLFPHGTDGWHVNLKLQNGRKLTAMVYYRYHIMVRQNVSVLLRAKRLF